MSQEVEKCSNCRTKPVEPGKNLCSKCSEVIERHVHGKPYGIDLVEPRQGPAKAAL